MENLFWKQNLYKVTNFLNVLTQTRDADCMIQNLQLRQQQQQQPESSFKASNWGSSLISGFCMTWSQFLLTSTGSEGHGGAADHPSGHHERVDYTPGHVSSLSQSKHVFPKHISFER